MRQDAILFSVIVPIYNVEPYLRPCVDSILGQTLNNFEVILVDDGSPDNCGAICDEYAAKDTRVKVIHKPNGGLVSARKAGAAACTGEYILNVDGDDYIAPNLMETLAAIAAKHHPDVIAFDGIRFTGNSQELFQNIIDPGLYNTADRLAKLHREIILNDADQLTILYSVWAKAVRRKVYVPFQMAVPSGISRGEDLAVTAPLLAHCTSVYMLAFAGYYYRNNPSSIMNTFHVSEVEQMKLLASFLEGAMGADYQRSIDAYVGTHYFDFLDRAMQRSSYRAYRQLIRETLDTTLLSYLKRAKSRSPRFNEQLVFFLMGHRWFGVLWILRHIKKRRV